jgi:hypothetical protein
MTVSRLKPFWIVIMIFPGARSRQVEQMTAALPTPICEVPPPAFPTCSRMLFESNGIVALKKSIELAESIENIKVVLGSFSQE